MLALLRLRWWEDACLGNTFPIEGLTGDAAPVDLGSPGRSGEGEGEGEEL